MQEHQSFPDANRLSVLLAIILFVYALIPFVNVPPQAITINLFRIQFNFNFNIHTLVSVLVAALAAVGVEWLVRSHPNLQENQPTYPHWMLPAFSAWVIDVPLSTIAIGPEWWIIFGFGGLFLMMIFVSEYITIDLSDAYHVPASVALSAVSYAFFLVLAIAVRAANMRLYVLVPAMVVAAALVCLRTLNLRLNGQWSIEWSLAAALIISQLTIGLHYLRLSPLSFGTCSTQCTLRHQRHCCCCSRRASHPHGVDRASSNDDHISDPGSYLSILKTNASCHCWNFKSSLRPKMPEKNTLMQNLIVPIHTLMLK